MLRSWVSRGGLRRQRATGAGVPPAIVFGHAGVALAGLLTWLAFLVTGWDLAAWLGVLLIAAAITLGISTVILWTPYPVVVPVAVQEVSPGGGPGGSLAAAPPDGTVTDEMIARLLAQPFPARRRRRLRLVPLIPAAHGLCALATFMFAVLAAISARLGRC